jgi:hypothetical protein
MDKFIVGLFDDDEVLLKAVGAVRKAGMKIHDGGKPFAAIPAYIPVTFEVTVLSASVTMVIAFFARCGFSLVKEPRIFDERITDDRHAMVFAFDEANAAKVRELLQQNGAVEIKEKSFES